MTLRAAIRVRLGAFELDVEIEAAAGETVAVLGPNGAGKTTLLRCLAGLTPIDRGQISLDGRVLEDPADRIRVSPQDRSAGMVFQQHLLFPSMTVIENIAFGARSQGVPRSEARRHAESWLEVVGLAGRGGDRPSELSGGQSQRVALARALAIDPKIVLLDEPLAALDVTTRSEIRRELRSHLDRLDGSVRLVVTHDPVDAFALADRVIIMEDGRVTQAGPLTQVAAQPTTRYLAELMGLNLFEGVGDERGVALSAARRWDLAAPTTGPVFVVVHPRDVVIGPVGGEDADEIAREGDVGRTRWTATVRSIDLERDRAVVRLVGPIDIAAELDALAAVQMQIRPGDRLVVSIAGDALRIYPRV